MDTRNFFVLLMIVNILIIGFVHSAPADNSSNVAQHPETAARDTSTCALYGIDCGVSCLAGDTLVTLSNGKQIPIAELQTGDQLLTTDGRSIFDTEMMMMLDQNKFGQAMFHTITTESGHKVSLTELHFISIVGDDGNMKYVPAKQLNVGDVIYVMENSQIIASTIKNIILETKTGYYGPLTTSGTFLSNGIVTSCYSNTQSHEMAHFYMGVLRAYYWAARAFTVNQPFGSSDVEGVHAVPKMLYELALFVYPSALRFT